MLGGGDGDVVVLKCPQCGARVETTAKQAETGKVRCPRGHEFAVMGMLDEPPGSGGQDRD
jgi:CxxC motif-containing protein